MTSIKPAIRSPAQSVHDIVPHLEVVEPVQEHLRFAIRHQIAVLIRNKNQPRRTKRPYAAKANLHTRELLRFVPKDRPLVEMPIVLAAVEHNNAVAQLWF